MRIVRLQASGFKRLVAVDITPDGDLVEVRGNNAEGKSSVLDSIFAALGGAAAAPIKPVRTGEEYALIRLDMGAVKVTRYFGADGTDRIKVENADGAVYTKGQTMLDDLVGSIAFDPLAFARMKAKDQAAELRRLVPLKVDLAALAKADRDDIAARRDINRDGKAVVARAEAIIVPNDLPADKPDREAIVAALGSAGETNSAIERESRRRDGLLISANSDRNEASRLIDEAAELRRQAEAADARAAKLQAAEKVTREEMAALPSLDPFVDTAKLSADLNDADRVLGLFADKDRHTALTAEAGRLRADSAAITQRLADRAAERSRALAEAPIPVDGLKLARVCDVVPGEEDEDLIAVYQGEPFAQASGAQQLRVSMALAMAANPKLRVMLIKDGSLLDANGLALVREMATDGGYQVWLESVGDDGAGIVMEAGKVRGAPEPERAEPPKRRKPKAEGEKSDPLAERGVAHGLAPDDAAKLAGFIASEEGDPPSTPAAKPKPRAMRSFSTKPTGGLFE